MLRRSRSFSAALVLIVLAVGLVACSDDDGGDGGSTGDSSSVELSTTPDSAMWDGGTADCPFTGVRAAEVTDTTPADEGVEGVLAFGTLSQKHVEGCIDYPVAPPVGGEHNEVWANCGFYSSAVP